MRTLPIDRETLEILDEYIRRGKPISKEGRVPDDHTDRLVLAGTRAKAVPLSDDAKRRVHEIMQEWILINEMAIALGVKLTKHDYREFMLRKMGGTG